MTIRSSAHFLSTHRLHTSERTIVPRTVIFELLPIVFPATSNLSWRVTPRRTLVPKGMDPIIDFGTCYTSTEAVFEPPSSFVMISAPGFFTSGVFCSLRAVIPVICENQVEMCCSLGWKTHIASSVHICVFGTSAQTIRKGGAILAEWSQCELKPWWRAHLLNQIKPISLLRWQRI